MIEAQEAALEGAHVAVPEGQVPATTMVTAEVDLKPPRQDAAPSDLCTFALSPHGVRVTLTVITPRLNVRKMRHGQIRNLPEVVAQLLGGGARTLVPRASHPQGGETGNPESAGGPGPVGGWLGGVSHRKPSREWADAEY